MEEPRKTDWFVQYLDEKFKTLSDLIANNKQEHDESRKYLDERITVIDMKHDAKHKETRYFFLATIAASSLLFIKESRDVMIAILTKFFL